MKIAISMLNFRPGRIGGTETYLRQLAAAMARIAPQRGHELVLACRRDNAHVLRESGAEIAVLEAGDARVIAARTLEAFTAYRSRAAERLFERIGPDVILFPQQTIFPKRIGRPYVLVVHDLQHLEHRENLPPFDRYFRPRAFGPALAGAAKVIAISEATRQKLLERCGAAAEKVITVRHGAPVLPKEIATFTRVPAPFLYYPAATHRHKEHAALLRAFAAFRAHAAGRDYRLVLSGQQTDQWPGLARLIEELGLRDAVVHLGFVPYEEILGVYQAAEAVVFPSRYEGLGLPVLEAAQLGKKVITSDLPVFAELGVPRERRIDFASLEQLLAALASGAPPLEKPVPTWEGCAEKTLEVLVGAASAASTGP